MKGEGYSGRSIGRRDFLRLAGGGLAGAALLGITGCGGDGAGTQGGEDEPIRIGALLSFSGVYTPLAEDIRRGLELFLELNGNQIAGREVEVRYEDDESDPQVALRLYRQLVGRDRVNFIVGPIISTVALALIDRLERDGVMLIVANAAANELSWEQKSDYAYRVSFSNYQNGSAGARYIAENVGRTAFTVAPDYVAGYEAIEGFRLAYEEAGGEVIEEAYPALGTNDFATYLTNIRRANPELVFAFLSGTDAIRFIQQYDSFGLKGQIPLTGTVELGDPLVTDPAGQSAEGIISGSHYLPGIDNETNRRFVEEFQSRHDRLLNAFNCQGYDSGQVIARAVEEAGSTEPEALIEVLRGISIESPRGPITIDPETNNPIQNYYIGENVWDGERIEVEVIETIEEVAMPPSPPVG
ncbi:ABC transporter substrate-binding protein [Rubrobacter taiwanensis]|uniref:ABC transporter substrate-binding protein n=1 Tax=Rubrobacter taiwanensis TaxID=185139 RepID=UPI001A9E65AB|nr:ABC transporter substrate-binding protein [Rubrobacter taiwanensis]